MKAHERDPAPSFEFNAVLEEFERKRRSGRPMLKPVEAASGPLPGEFSDRFVESVWSSNVVSEERMTALEESLRLMDERWPAEPVGSVSRTRERPSMGSGDRLRRAGSAGFTEPTSVSILSSGYGSRPRQSSQVSCSVQWPAPEETETWVGRPRSSDTRRDSGMRFGVDDSSSDEERRVMPRRSGRIPTLVPRIEEHSSSRDT